jgi:hypothetical protein
MSLSTVSVLELRPCGAVLYVMLSSTVPTRLCLTTDRRDVAVGLTLEVLRESRLWAVVLGEVKSKVADKAALNDPVGHLLRRNAHYERSMSFARSVPAVEPRESHDPETIVEGLFFLL